MRTIFWTGLIVFVLDQLSKYYVVHMLDLDRVRAIDVFVELLQQLRRVILRCFERVLALVRCQV